ncbi:MAG TPA: RidA family protein [Verrucomicrobiae bacterium]|nr:RidA family protein [Verrucomicrobiae bacterium]
MDMESRRKFVNSMMAASLAAMGGGVLFAQDFTPMGGVQIGPDGANGNPPPGPIGEGTPQESGAGGGRGRGGRGRGPRVPRPQPAGIYWISGTGIERQPGPNTWDIKDHTKLTMDNVKRGVEARGGTMDSFLYMQVFFCLRSDDSTPMPTGSAAAAAYQQSYTDLTAIYNTYFTSRPPRSCFALSWIPGSSLIEVVGAAYIDPSAVPPPPESRG